VDHEGICPPPQLILLAAGHLRRDIPQGERWVVIDTQDIEVVGGALGQGRGHLAGSQGMGTVQTSPEFSLRIWLGKPTLRYMHQLKQ
jgi:hypothetical protein